MRIGHAGAQGLAAHYDDHCVIVLQLQGSKQWLLRAPPASQRLPLTYEPRQPVAPLADGAPGVTAVAMCPGDVLYVPRGWAHQARSLPAALGGGDGSSGGGGACIGNGDGSSTSSGAGGSGSSDGELLSHCSVHVTFGLDVDLLSTWQGCLHAAVHSCCSLSAGPQSQPAGSCPPGDPHLPAGSQHSTQAADARAAGAGAIAAQSSMAQHQLEVQAACQLVLHLWVTRQAAALPDPLRRACPLLLVPSAVAVAGTLQVRQCQPTDDGGGIPVPCAPSALPSATCSATCTGGGSSHGPDIQSLQEMWQAHMAVLLAGGEDQAAGVAGDGALVGRMLAHAVCTLQGAAGRADGSVAHFGSTGAPAAAYTAGAEGQQSELPASAGALLGGLEALWESCGVPPAVPAGMDAAGWLHAGVRAVVAFDQGHPDHAIAKAMCACLKQLRVPASPPLAVMSAWLTKRHGARRAARHALLALQASYM